MSEECDINDMEKVDAVLRSVGIDPVECGKRGEALARVCYANETLRAENASLRAQLGRAQKFALKIARDESLFDFDVSWKREVVDGN